MIVLGSIFYQDVKERQVYWFFFLLLAIFSGVLHYNRVIVELFLLSVLINITLISILLFILFLYSKYKLKIKFTDAIGLGDVLLFIALSFAFSSVSFIVLFVSALIFSLALHLILKKKSQNKTVPLAGYMCLFIGMAYLGYWFEMITSIYII